jgi:hypothetical protein
VGLINQAPTLMGEKDLVPFEFKEGSDMTPVKIEMGPGTIYFMAPFIFKS